MFQSYRAFSFVGPVIGNEDEMSYLEHKFRAPGEIRTLDFEMKSPTGDELYKHLCLFPNPVEIVDYMLCCYHHVIG